MVGNRAWSGGRNSRQESALKWRPLKGGISISNQRWGERESEGGREREKEGVRDCGGSGERERDKKRDIHSRLTNQREREEEEGGILKGSQGQSAKVKERHRNGGRWTADRRRRRRRGMKEKQPWKETMCTSELGENPAGDATGSFLPLVPLFSSSDSDNELSSMGLPPLLCLRRVNPPVPPRLRTQSHTG